MLRAALVLYALTACAPPAVPADPTGAVACEAPATLWTTLYVDRDGDAGADRAIQVQRDSWRWDDETGPGVFTTLVAEGAVGDEGALLGMPAGLFDDARSVWSFGGSCTVGGAPVRRHR